MIITKEVSERFSDYIFDWDYKQYLSIGGYGSGKSYHNALKIILKCMSEKRKVLVVREVYETIKESCFDLINEILEDMDLLADDNNRMTYKAKVRKKNSPMEFVFPNGSRIIFRGMDKSVKLKSINGVSIVWLEECSEIKYSGYKELLGRLRTPNVKTHFLLSCNPVGRENWVYNHFFTRQDDEGKTTIICDENEMYKRKTLIKNGVYYLHSTADDNPYLPEDYLKELDDMRNYDPILYRVARLGHFGAAGTRVLPQFEVAKNAKEFKAAVQSISMNYHFIGFDFGFETSYNAVVSMAVDTVKKYLYIYNEIYVNHITDDKMANQPEMLAIKEKQINGILVNPIVGDNEDPKAIDYYRQCGYKIRSCRNKFAGSRLANTRKVKRFKKIICSPKCANTIKELRDLTYKIDSKGNVIYDDFNIDPHTFSAIWYALDNYNVADIKTRKYNSKSGSNS
jgi:phage terminase large subunit